MFRRRFRCIETPFNTAPSKQKRRHAWLAQLDIEIFFNHIPQALILLKENLKKFYFILT